MVDYFSLALTHGILLVALWRLMQRDDLDVEPLRQHADEAEAAPEPEQKPKPGQLRRA